MKYWVFHQEQLDAALREHATRSKAEGMDAAFVDAAERHLRAFLASPIAVKHKLVGAGPAPARATPKAGKESLSW